MTLAVDVRHRLGAFALDARFEAGGGIVALFGASGSGKTSLVDLIGGLARPDAGRIVVDGRVLADSKARLFVPGHKRRIGYVFQDARLFPHLTVSQNLRYGRWFTPASERYAGMAGIVELLGIGHLLNRRPDGLSGGEKQRVAIGRALIASPRLLLMDEPLAALDYKRKAEILPYIERLRDEVKIPIVYVSHSVAEVARLAGEIVVMAEGKVIAHGPTSAILQRLDLLPETEQGEGGAVLTMTATARDAEFGITLLRSPAGDISVTGFEGGLGGAVRVRIRARDVMIATERPRNISALNVLSGTIAGIGETSGPLVDVSIDCGGQPVAARITRKSRHELNLSPGLDVFAVVKAVTLDQAFAAARPDTGQDDAG